MPKLDIDAIPVRSGSIYPGALNNIIGARTKRALGDAGNLNQFGVNLTQLPPGSASAHRHWHAKEDEFIYILSGEGILIEDDQETMMKAGDAACFPANVKNGHHVINRSHEMLLLLEVGTRASHEEVTYTDPEVDMKISKLDHNWKITRKDGSSMDDD